MLNWNYLTLRQKWGGALGVAVLGAVLSASYEKEIAATAAKFPGAVGEALQSSLAVAMQVADKLGPMTQQVIDAAQTAFMTGVSHSALIAAVIIFVAALIAFFGLPKHTAKDSDTI